MAKTTVVRMTKTLSIVFIRLDSIYRGRRLDYSSGVSTLFVQRKEFISFTKKIKQRVTANALTFSRLRPFLAPPKQHTNLTTTVIIFTFTHARKRFGIYPAPRTIRPMITAVLTTVGTVFVIYLNTERKNRSDVKLYPTCEWQITTSVLQVAMITMGKLPVQENIRLTTSTYPGIVKLTSKRRAQTTKAKSAE